MRIDFRVVRRAHWIVVGGSLLFAIGFIAVEVYDRGTRALYERAAVEPEAHNAIVELGKRHGGVATDLLFQLARQHGLTGTEAVKALSQRSDDDVPDMLASFLQPSEDLSIRQAAAEGLTRHECDFGCIRTVLHYRERETRNVSFREDWLTVGTSAAADDARRETAQGRGEVDKALDEVLKKSPHTAVVLEKVYGVGSPVPDPFALDLIEHLKLTASCNDLTEFDRRFKPHPSEEKFAPERVRLRERLRDISKKIGC
jgi:hypothetical protein